MPSEATMRAESKDVPFSLVHLGQSISLTGCCLGPLAKHRRYTQNRKISSAFPGDLSTGQTPAE